MKTYRVDLHVHTNASLDGRTGLEDLCRAAKKAGLDAIAITDHDQCTPLPEAVNGILLIPGCEISTRGGHITGLFLERPVDLEALGHRPKPEQAVAAIRQAGGLAVLAHPYQKPGAEHKPFSLDGIETANARAAFKVPNANGRAAELARAWNLPAVGGSDAHDGKELGNAWTELTAPERTVPALREALRSGQSCAVLKRNTPLIRNGLSQWRKAQRQGSLPRLAKGGAYLAYSAVKTVVKR